MHSNEMTNIDGSVSPNKFNKQLSFIESFLFFRFSLSPPKIQLFFKQQQGGIHVNVENVQRHRSSTNTCKVLVSNVVC